MFSLLNGTLLQAASASLPLQLRHRNALGMENTRDTCTGLASCSAGAVHLLPGKLEVLHRPKLERLCWDGWICPNAPLSLGVVSSITELRLICIAVPGFKPSNVLRGSTALQDLTLSFQGESLWLMTRGKTTLRCVQQTEEVITS